ncbi:aliphatic sulfonate ABC transporter substrate-binding protein [Saccharopolyspora phatthalungensis]|uniref:NitT/TauT family transport system substrate-binding protein n=1 Tax=Saccharopolyspora phatthalungensis TaxID=664693 RepID=A0A840QIE4_9PSEU|nr:aliphatic sulfonate ABC transporter substrate-binding protein [Saccharopolyspora phatthalungensis]MBB5160027.1 NitT/TauT family transport system substrate-binding protein [Saccharopolyspora phatthalungensis]
MITRKRLLSLLMAVLASTLVLAGCGSTGASQDEVKFGYIADFNGTSLLAIAQDQGLWEKHGLKATTSVFTNGPLQIQALGSGDLDFGYIGPGAMWLPASGQAKVVALNTLGNADRVIAQPGIKSMADLRGKTVGVPQGTSGEMLLGLALRKAGMSKQDIKVVPMDPSTVVSAFSSKRIDAAGIWYPLISTIKKQQPDLVELAKNSDFAEQVQFPTAFVAANKVVADQPDKTKKVISVLRDAIAYRSANPDKTIALTAKMLHIDEQAVRADAANVNLLTVPDLDRITKDGTVDKWLTGMNDYFVQAGTLKQPVDPKTYYTGDLFTAAGQ